MDRYKVTPGRPIRLSDFDPEDTGLFDGEKAAAKAQVDKLNDELESLQELMYAEHKRKLLVVLQAMDTGGKDGLIRSVFDGVNPQGVKVVNFKAPTPIELDHDYLWRVHPHVPGKGEMVIFNRSHYEDVLIVRVQALVPESVWRRRYRHIREFERMLADEGVTILKFYLHISKDEQKRRLQARLDDPNKHWKFNTGDLKARARWDDYMRAYEDALNETSTEWAPWYVIPANKKWYRDWVALNIILDTLKGFKMRYPQSQEDLSGVVIE
ncbi:MAG: polyphosphate kinase 2 family protein [Chloroflexi bacterium]|jgi:PPK2 family polyphosphate:nucleotide phosphotransferase|uniref:Polyphosphate kinase n=1 Tax=Candidatus Thermofonsia Clade 3 bacterium TaxID=2364212 RepID=A0A2M8QBE0_9CHLR|nr:polyphosphate kinase 2 family protein [Candidatus Roseilinea sp. NK_OTU-006]PJF47109.1 MAG: polyphosphate kinase [Candidatus Thermofonsia Clade 3 bacterium]RMG64954.1 MAG: polyphosphate kinase 2 family protein [Chloroflexota bacterium]